ncbi:MAG TPA: 5-formyltetrahydrofolate cyclo-ligase [Bacillota bacterium]|nr:5-formyltetrahydrofolate cyclo-ligase [Bacillota bacterium]
MTTDIIQQAKRDLRKEMKGRLKGLTAGERESLNRRIHEFFFRLDAVKKAKTVMIYYGIGTEIDTVPLIEGLLAEGKRVGLPICRADLSLDIGEIESLNQVKERYFKHFTLMEPWDTPLLDPAVLDLVIIPGIAFDMKGNRLGHGAGYYDRFLSRVPQTAYKLGLAYDIQVTSEVPVTDRDQPLNGLLTPTRFFQF